MYTQSIITYDMAAAISGKTKKRLQNIVSEYQKKNKRLPHWVISGGGMRRMIDREEFNKWLSETPRRSKFFHILNSMTKEISK